MYKSKIELQKSNKPRQPNLRKCNVISRFLSVTHKFDLKTIKIKQNGKFKSSKN